MGVIVLFLLSVYGWTVKEAAQGKLGWGHSVKNGLLHFVGFLDLFEKSVEEVKQLPKTFVTTPEDFEPVNRLQRDLWSLISYSDADKKRSVEIRNLRNDSVARHWQVSAPGMQPHHRVMHPLLLPDSSLVYSLNGFTGLFCVNKNGQPRWTQDSIAHHHGLNLGPEGHIWACSYTRDKRGRFIVYRGAVRLEGRPLNFIDNTLSKIDPATGELLYHRSISRILKENDLEHLLLKTPRSTDPYHLNDVQPVFKSGPYWQRGDLFLSLRNVSAILHFRPATGEVVRLLEGPFYAQHDVDVRNDSTLSIFNNNCHVNWQSNSSDHPIPEKRISMGDNYSQVLLYQAGEERYTPAMQDLTVREQIFTFTEGIADWLDEETVFVEEQNSGILWVLSGDEVLYRQALPSHHEGHHHLPNWTRILPTP